MLAATSEEETRAVNRAELLGLARTAPGVCAVILRQQGFFTSPSSGLWYTPMWDRYARLSSLEQVWELYCTSEKFAHLR